VHRVRVRRIPPSHDCPAERVRRSSDGRSKRFDRVGGVYVDRLSIFAFLVIGALGTVMPGSAYAATSDWNIEGRRPAVAAPNARLSASGDYTHADSTEASSQSGTATSTLRIGEIETQSGQAELVGTLPLTHSTGVRGKLRGGFSSQSEDGRFGNQDIDTSAYGAAVELFLRDPDLGSFTLGGSYDRIDGDDDFDANAFGGVADLRIFFPDFGSGKADWFLRFDYERREVEGTGRPFDPRIDTYRVSGGGGWYFTENFQFLLGGSWTRAENHPISREDSEGFVTVRWRLPTTLSLELTLGGSAGVSEYEQSPFPSDDRMIYGGHVGVTYRFESGATLVESIRAFD
jgi:hypothetical protein